MAKKPDPGKPPGDRKPLPEDDAALFDSAMRGVKRISLKPGKQPAPAVKASPAPERAPPRAKRLPFATSRPGATLSVLAAGKSADVDARTLDRLRRGRLPLEARLDLHGLTQEKAHRVLTDFIARALSSGLRSVIIITGKGRVSEGGGVLRNQVPQWLNAPDIRPGILAFTPAQPRDGGAGAFYVLLRRRR
jgi:DNA-nicking Smr family endonuclease